MSPDNTHSQARALHRQDPMRWMQAHARLVDALVSPRCWACGDKRRNPYGLLRSSPRWVALCSDCASEANHPTKDVQMRWRAAARLARQALREQMGCV